MPLLNLESLNSKPDAEPTVPVPTALSHQGSYGYSWMRDAVKAQIADDVTSRRPHQELDDYLAAPLEDVNDVVSWWGVSLH